MPSALRTLKQLILTGDDFGRSHAVNEAVERCFEAGLLTQASLMVNEPAAEEAVRIAKRHPQLSVGLHLTLCDGRATQRSAITSRDGNLIRTPAAAGWRYAFDLRIRVALAREIEAQFRRFHSWGIAPGHLDGHTHLHLHPLIFRMALPWLAAGGFRQVRLVREPGNRSPVALIFRLLSATALPKLQRLGIGAADQVFGLAGTGRMTTERMARLFDAVPEGLTEIYFHPGAEPAEFEAAALREKLHARGITLTTTAQLPQSPPTHATAPWPRENAE